MRFKAVPDPPGFLSFVAEARAAVPLVPGSEVDCCDRLLARTDLQARDDAREWLTFLRALGLVEKSARGFHRTRNECDRTVLASTFRERVYLAEDTLAVLDEAADPLDADAVFERLQDRVPRWERDRHADWEQVWRERVRRILDWAVLLGLAAREESGYRLP